MVATVMAEAAGLMPRDPSQRAPETCRHPAGEPDGPPPAPGVGDHRRRCDRQRRTGHGGAHARHRDVEQPAPACGQRVEARVGRRQPGERIGDGVRAEHRRPARPSHQTAGHRCVVTEGDAVGRCAGATVPRDGDPHLRAALSDHVAARDARIGPARGAGWPQSRRRPAGPARGGDASPRCSADRGQRSSCASSGGRRTRPRPRRAPSGRLVDSTFTTVAPAPASRSPQSGPAHRAERSTTSRPCTSVAGDSPRRSATTAVASAASPSLATGRPSTAARSTSARRIPRAHGLPDGGPGAGARPRRVIELEPSRDEFQVVGPWSETASHPSPAGRRRQLPPQLVVPRRHNPISAARSPSRASGSSPGKTGARRSTPSTRPLGRTERFVRAPGQRHRAAGRPTLPPGDRPRRQGNVI